ncbi:MAG: hypothetical protein M3O46_04885, partial [Myxococcota bacterium]|nr:hypothetical protein [Myxococcota bacterium]
MRLRFRLAPAIGVAFAAAMVVCARLPPGASGVGGRGPRAGPDESPTPTTVSSVGQSCGGGRMTVHFY